ncbi:hypothetical protein BDN72DRAFT_862935 [Pluteus cervinus]|uniref:Uncharacterized protein n=1 Tax=Pluteus cervinus TaxID=181527 RepID=A0ACD3AA62_9AGAR|nr:hypothetical protein BDN72DRAFT_862935 [Pluteus cervinus]
MQFQNEWGTTVLCHKAEGRSYHGTHYLCRIRGQVIRDELSLQPDAHGYNGILVLQPSDNPQLAKFFTDGVDTLTRMQQTLKIPEGRLINVIQDVGGQRRFSLLAMAMANGYPFLVKDTEGDIVPLQHDRLTLEGSEVDVVFSFYHMCIAFAGESEPKVQTVARLLEIQILL